MRSILTYVVIGFSMAGLNHLVFAQNDYNAQYMEASMGFSGSRQNVSLSYQFTVTMDVANEKHKPLMMLIGLGARFTSYFGSKEFFVTVPEMIYNPARLKSFPDPDPTKKDSVFVSGPQMQCLNMFFNLNFQLKKWLRVGLNGDIIGYSFGPQRQGVYINGAQTEAVTVTPEHYNCFWVGAGDQSGMLMVEFYVEVHATDRITFKLAGQSLDMEYRTDRQVQTYPRTNDRFRLQSYMSSAGIVYLMKKKRRR